MSRNPDQRPDHQPTRPAELLRRQARERAGGGAADPGELDANDVRSLVEELRVHQFELEIQNEELRAAQTRLAESRDRYQALYELAPGGYLTLDEGDRIVECNNAASALLGQPHERLLGARMGDFVAPESIDTYHHHWAGATAGGHGVSELALHNLRGHRWYIQFETSAEAAPPQRLLCALSDITARKRAEQGLANANARLESRVAERTAELRASEAHLGTILETVPTGIVTVDTQGVIATMNPAADRIFGDGGHGAIGYPLVSLLAQPYAGEYERYLRNPADYPRYRPAAGREIEARRRDGTLFPAEIAVTYVDEIERFVIALRDVSESRRLESEVLHAVEDERARVSRELHDGVGQKLAGLAMTARGVAARQAPDATDSETLGQFSSELQSAVRDLRGAIHDLNPEDLAGQDLATALERLAREAGERYGVTCAYVGPSAPPEPARNIAVQLLRIASEALYNALRHGGPSRVELTLEPREGGLTLTVSDDGVGLDPEQAQGQSEGMGLRIMRYRARMIGAHLEIGDQRAGGVAVRCSLSR